MFESAGAEFMNGLSRISGDGSGSGGARVGVSDTTWSGGFVTATLNESGLVDRV